jgi:hypothetical protein
MNAYLDFWGQWLPPAVLLGLSLFLLLSRAGRSYAEEFVAPALLLLFRKVALFMPVPGLVATEDRVAFLSTRAVIYFVFVALGTVLPLIVLFGDGRLCFFAHGGSCPVPVVRYPYAGRWLNPPGGSVPGARRTAQVASRSSADIAARLGCHSGPGVVGLR